MERTLVTSSNIASIGYDPNTQTLEIEFLHGGVYQYFDVPQNEYEALLRAGSHGEYFASAIKGYYRYAKV